MKIALTIIALLIVLPPAIGLAYYWWRYRASEIFLWKQSVLKHVRDLEADARELSREPSGCERSIARLADDFFLRHLATIPLAKLVDYPNIGPATIERLREAGYRQFADAANASFEGIPDVGPVRAKALRSAVKSLVKEARSRFESGGCPEAQAFRQQVDEMRRAEAVRTAATERELASVDRALNETLDLLPIARAVSFLDFVLNREVIGLTPEVMSRALPEPIPALTRGVVAAPPIDLFRAELNQPVRPQVVPPPASPGLARMKAIIGFGFAIAKADGKVAQAERKAIREYLEQTCGHDAVLLRNIDPLMEQIEKAIPDVSVAIAGVREAVPIAEHEALVRWAERIADASGERNQKEREVLLLIQKELDLAAPLQAVPTAAVEPAAPDARVVLELTANTELSADLIRRRYHQLTEKLDAGKAAAFGPELARLADEKRTRIRAAAEALIAAFHEPLEKPALPPPTDLRNNPDLDDVFGA